MPSRALTVAIAAGALLVVVVGADVAMNRHYHLEAQLDGSWVKLASFPYTYGAPRAIPSLATFDLNASDEVPMRVRVENGYPWAFSEPVTVLLYGRPVFEGVLAAPPREEGVATFTVNGTRLFQGEGFHDAPPREPAPVGGRYYSPFFEVIVGDDVFGGSLSLREVPR